METAGRDSRPVGVSQLIGQLRGLLEPRFGAVRVRGEISSFTEHGSGHLYFYLKDRTGQLRCTMFRDKARRLKMSPADGLQVVLSAAVSIYTTRGELQLLVQSMEPDGLGQLFEALERLKRKLEAEGLFEQKHKRPLPFLPRRVAVITSPQGAVLHDIHTTLRRRNPAVELICAPAAVQGAEAPRQIVRALRRVLQEPGVDCVILARGGGSLIDLMPFNHEAVIRALASYPLPVISAIGHETDHTLCDLVVDRRAPTPTAAAELVAPAREDLLEQLAQIRFRCERALQHRVLKARKQLDQLAGCSLLRDPVQIVERRRQFVLDARRRLTAALDARSRAQRVGLARLEQRVRAHHPLLLAQAQRQLFAHLQQRLHRAAENRLTEAHRAQAVLKAKIEMLSPLRMLERGYALCLDSNGHPIAHVDGRKVGEGLEVRLHNGSLGCRLESISRFDRPDPSASDTPSSDPVC
jgi:exodeoxyribonuclease VII large subunit